LGEEKKKRGKGIAGKIRKAQESAPTSPEGEEFPKTTGRGGETGGWVGLRGGARAGEEEEVWSLEREGLCTSSKTQSRGKKKKG